MKRLVLGLLVLASLTFAPAVVAAPGPPASSFTGIWTAVDCASWWEDAHLDCSVWGDGSQQTLRIGFGEAPRVTYEDAYASFCFNNGGHSTRWIAAGSGEFDTPYLWVNFTKSGCGEFGTGGYTIQLYYDPGSDTIWEDTDGDLWGTTWYRAP